MLSEVAYLGHIIGRDGVKTNLGKVQAIKSFHKPKNVRVVRQFLGLTEYYRKFIKDYAKLAKTLTDLLKYEITFE